VILHLNPQHEQAGHLEPSLGARVQLPASRSTGRGRIAAIVRGWTRIRAHLVEWRCRARAQRELMTLSDHDLWDIGMVRSTAEYEASKPVWRK
jgi:uncharacterized protein YjiS (DUF1127 family)